MQYDFIGISITISYDHRERRGNTLPHDINPRPKLLSCDVPSIERRNAL